MIDLSDLYIASPMLDLHTFPQQNTEYELTELDDEIILLSVKHEKAVYLNQTAQLIWRLCDGSASIDELITALNILKNNN